MPCISYKRFKCQISVILIWDWMSVYSSSGYVLRERFSSSGILLDVCHGFLGYCGNPSCSVLQLPHWWDAEHVQIQVIKRKHNNFFKVSMFLFLTLVFFFSLGVIALVLYYRFLHPKSFEIFQSIRHRGIAGACMERGSTLSLEEKVTPTFHRHATLSGL